jgi:3-oxoadipate enol-lactonase
MSGWRVGVATALLGALAWILAREASAIPRPDSTALHWIDANGVSLRYELAGRGPSTVVLLHEVGMTLESWDEVMPALTPTWQVLRYDLRGFGESEKIRGSISLDEEAADLTALLDRLGLREPVTLVGGALGASIALRFAAEHPDRTARLVLISPVFNAPNAAGTRASAAAVPAAAPAAPGAQRPMGPDPATLIEQHGIRAYLDERQLEALYPTSLRTDASRWRRFLGIELSGDPESRAATLRMVSHSSDATADLTAVRCPTLVIATALFALRTPEVVRSIALAIPGAQFEALPTGHLAALESPQLLAPALLRFLRAPAP